MYNEYKHKRLFDVRCSHSSPPEMNHNFGSVWRQTFSTPRSQSSLRRLDRMGRCTQSPQSGNEGRGERRYRLCWWILVVWESLVIAGPSLRCLEQGPDASSAHSSSAEPFSSVRRILAPRRSWEMSHRSLYIYDLPSITYLLLASTWLSPGNSLVHLGLQLEQFSSLSSWCLSWRSFSTMVLLSCVPVTSPSIAATSTGDRASWFFRGRIRH